MSAPAAAPPGGPAGLGGKRGEGVGGRRLAGLPLLLIVVVAAAFVTLRSDWLPLAGVPGARAESDFELHWAAGQALASGRNAYDPAVVDEIGRRAGRDFTPFCAANPLVVRLFGLFGEDFAGAYGRWFAANIVLLAAAVLLLARAVRLAGAAPAAETGGLRVGAAAALAIALAMVALDDGTWMALVYNQVNVVTLLLVAAALVAALSGRPALEGVLLALAACAKTSPALLVVCAALAGRWRTVRAAAVTGAVLLGASLAWNGGAIHARYLEVVLGKLGYAAVVPGEFNNSLHAWNLAPNGLLSVAAHVRGWPLDAVRAAAWVVTAAVLAALAVALRGRRGPRAPRDVFGLYALGVSGGFLASSVTWPTHLSLAAVPASWLVLYAWGGGNRRHPVLLALAALACAVLFLPLGSLATMSGESFDTPAKAGACILLFTCIWSFAIDRTADAAGA